MKSAPPRSVTALDNIYGMRVIVRASLDVPIRDGVVQNEFRVKSAIPTIEHLIGKGARVIILTHVGRDPKNSTLPLLASLQKYVPTTYVDALLGEKVEGAITHMKEGTALLLENVRSHAGEEANDEEFARTLSAYGNFYVNDAFAVSHRAHASIVGLAKMLPNFAGISFLQEYSELSKMLSPEHPSLFILGGAKFETKAPLIEKYAERYTHTLIGGALANDFLKGKGYEVGESLLSPVDLTGSPLLAQENILLPIDVVAVKGVTARVVPADSVYRDEKILDVGPKTIEHLAPFIAHAKTILWNGPLGNYEGGYDEATKACAELVAQSDAFSVVGGGDTVAAIEALNLSDSFGFLSTAGGAMLEFLEKGTLPGIEVLTHAE